MNNNLQELINLGKPYLRQYLIDNGVEIVKKGTVDFFRCIHPEHEDRNPSNGFVKGSGDEQFHCFSCQASGDVYTAAAYLEGKPQHGLAFIKDNVEYILKKYQIEYIPVELDDETLTKLKYEAVYEAAFTLMTYVNPLTNQFEFISTENAQSRGWSIQTCKEMGIGSIKDLAQFQGALSKRTGFTIQEIDSMGIKGSLFGPDFITFAIKDHTRKVKGFVARFMKWTRGCDTPKYRNTSMEDNPFYHKERILYCIDIAKAYNMYRLDIFEGYGSAVTAHQAGYKHCVAIGGTALTEHHVELVKSLGFTHLNLVLDQDETGSKLMEKYIERFSGIAGVQITVTHLPFTDDEKKVDGFNDPDAFIRAHGITEYRKLKPVGVFEHMIKKFAPALDPTTNSVFTKDFVKQMIPLVINDSNRIERAEKISTLAKISGMDKEDIKMEIERLEKTDVKNLKDDLAKKIRQTSDADQIMEVLSGAMTNIQESSSTKQERYLLSLTETVQVFDDVFMEMNELAEGTHGWKTGFEALDSMLDGIPKPLKGGAAIGLAGAPQHGKSALMLNLAVKLALNNNDIAICYWAIDDHRKAIAYRLISMISEVPMKKVRNSVRRTHEEEIKIKEAQDILRMLISSRKLTFKDDKYGRTKKKAENWIKETQDATGNPILFCIDSLHNVQGSGDQETRVKLLSSSGWAKALTASVPCTVMATMEVVKNRLKGEKPNLTWISESGKMEFDFDTLGIVWNEAQGNYCNVAEVDNKWGTEGNWKPIIELSIQKNKAGAGERGSLYFQYDTDTTGIVGCQTYKITSKDVNGSNNKLTAPIIIKYGNPGQALNRDSDDIAGQEDW